MNFKNPVIDNNAIRDIHRRRIHGQNPITRLDDLHKLLFIVWIGRQIIDAAIDIILDTVSDSDRQIHSIPIQKDKTGIEVIAVTGLIIITDNSKIGVRLVDIFCNNQI